MARSKSARKADLLEAAQRAMAEHGASVRLNQVAQQAGLTSGAILYHYPDLQDLLVDANRAGMERFHDARAQAIGKLVLPDALARQQASVDDGFQNPPIDLVDQVRERVERDHTGCPVRNTEFRVRH